MRKKLMHMCCWFNNRPYLLLVIVTLFLFVVFLLRRWLEPLLILYFGILILLGLIGLTRLLGGILRKRCRKISAAPKGTGSDGHPPSNDIYIPPRIYKRPDPLIYSQFYLISQGIAVTWDNPDIQLYDGQNLVSSHDVTPGKTYTIRAQIWNGSIDAPAVNVLVRFYYLSFGAGTLKNYIGQNLVDVPVKGAVDLPALVEYPWTTPSTPGHYCIQVELDWPDDANPNNNLGQKNIDIKKLNSPNATFKFLLRNDSTFKRRLILQVDTYTLPDRYYCSERPQVRAERDPYSKHRSAQYPLPDGWYLEFLPGNIIELAPEQEQEVTIKVTAADDFVGQMAINVNALDDTALAGGVTLYVHS